jgi:hypothetical protein
MSPPRAPPLALRAVRAYLSDFVLGDVNDLEDIHNLQAIFKYPKDGLSVCTGNDKLDAGTKYGAYKCTGNDVQSALDFFLQETHQRAHQGWNCR